MVEQTEKTQPEVSVVCPFHNEAQILEPAIGTLLAQLRMLGRSWELLVVNDGSDDGSGGIAERLARENPNLRAIGYAEHRGRGYALREGIAAARGEIIVTTEMDLTWGAHIVHDLVRALGESPEADIVLASPHLPGGGYKGVPFFRVWVSRLGNWLIRACLGLAPTMNTGMARAYRAPVIRSLPLGENDKEFHLEVVHKAAARDYVIREIPAALEWKEHERAGQQPHRRSSTHLLHTALGHIRFLFRASPLRTLGVVSLCVLIPVVLVLLGWVLWPRP